MRVPILWLVVIATLLCSCGGSGQAAPTEVENTLTPEPLLTHTQTPTKDPLAAMPPATATLSPEAKDEVAVKAVEPGGSAVGTTRTRPTDNMDMVYVPGGEFLMGSSEGQIAGATTLCEEYPDDYGKCKGSAFEPESPQHPVAVSDFWIDGTEVTNAQYTLCVEAGACEVSRLASNPQYNQVDYPVAGVPWQDAADYCAWAGARLPTEAEWEYAARGPEGFIYPWGDEFECAKGSIWDDRGCEDGYPGPAPVGAFTEGTSWCGAQDLAGNVWEWVADFYGPYPEEGQVDPTGPKAGDERILRGGSWGYGPPFVRSAYRYPAPPGADYLAVGFRCAITAAEKLDLTATPVPPSSTPTIVPPTPSASSAARDVLFSSIRDVPYSEDDGRQRLDIYLPEIEGPLPVLLALQGRGGGKGGLGHFGRHFASRGYAVVAIDRRSGQYPEDEQDAFCALGWIHASSGEYGFDPERITAVGFSRGGALAGLLGTVGDPGPLLEGCPHALPEAKRIQSVISVAGISDFAKHVESRAERSTSYDGYFGGDAERVPEAWAEASPITWVDGSEPPFLLIHGETDRTVNHEQSTSFAAALEEARVDVTLELMPVLSHMSIANSIQAFEVIERFLAELELSSEPAPEAAATETPLPRDTLAPPTSTPEPTAVATAMPALTGSGGGLITFDAFISAGYNLEIYVMNAGGSTVRRLTNHPADDSEPDWSPAGAPGGLRIAFVSERDGNKELYMLDLDEALQSAGSAGLQRLTDNEADDYSPSWSPDGTQLAFISERHGNPEVYVQDVQEALQDPEGAVARRLTRNNAREVYPVWSPAGVVGGNEADGGQIAFASDRDGNWEIYTISADGSSEDGAQRLTHSAAHDTDPAWSLDGTWIAFSSSDGDSRRIFLMDAAGDEQGSAEPKRLTTNQGQAFDPVWSPDGARILYSVHNIDKNPGLYVMNADGSQNRYIPEALSGYHQDWHPYTEVSRAGDAAASPKQVVNAPSADAPSLDGTLGPKEWSDANIVELDGGHELLLMHDGDYVYLGIRSPEVGLGSLCLDRGSQVAVLHASAALGTALYELDANGWQPVQDFSWSCRSTSYSSYAQREREEFLAANGWLGTNVNLGTPGELEYQIEMDGGPVRLALSYLGAGSGDEVIGWPADLTDDCGLLGLVQGNTPSDLQFSPDTWVTIQAKP